MSGRWRWLSKRKRHDVTIVRDDSERVQVTELRNVRAGDVNVTVVQSDEHPAWALIVEAHESVPGIHVERWEHHEDG